MDLVLCARVVCCDVDMGHPAPESRLREGKRLLAAKLQPQPYGINCGPRPTAMPRAAGPAWRCVDGTSCHGAAWPDTTGARLKDGLEGTQGLKGVVKGGCTSGYWW